MKTRRIGLLCLLVVIIGGLTWGGLALAIANTQPPPYPSYASSDFFFPPYPSDNERMGFGKASAHDTTPLNAGWYLDWGARANPSHLGGVEYARVIRLKTSTSWCQTATNAGQVTPSLTGTALINAVQAHPGALWLIGNEPDSLYNGDPIQAELYAEFYHYFVTTIKAADPTARVAVAAIVQPSPLRMEYLDKVLNRYQASYNEPLPADLWNIHFYILNEGPCGSWGGAVPPFSSQSIGWNIPFNANTLLDLTALEENLRAFRRWMYDRGYQDMPLIITEFGVLPPPSFPGFSDSVAAQFLSNTFQMFLTATDPLIGYPADGNRLLQMWAWFSTDYQQYGGDLFKTGTISDLTIIGDAFVAQANANYRPYVDLQVAPASNGGSDILADDTISVDTYLNNRGNSVASGVQARITLIDYFNQTVLDTTDLDLGDLATRYAHAPLYVGKTWNVSLPGAFTVTVTADPNQTSGDANPANNTFSQRIARFPDLALSSLDVLSISLGAADEIATSVMTATVTNIGVWTSTAISLRIQVQKVETQPTSFAEILSIPPLASGQNVHITTTWAFSSGGLYQITATINPDNISKIEVNADNNVAVQTIFISEPQPPGATIYLPLIIRHLPPYIGPFEPPLLRPSGWKPPRK